MVSTFFHGDIILNWSNNGKISIEISASQQAGGFIIKHLRWKFKYCCAQIENLIYWLTVKQSMSSHHVTVPRHVFLYWLFQDNYFDLV